MKNAAKLFVATATTALVLAGCATTQKWEYRTRTVQEKVGKSGLDQYVLDQYGKGGWELVQFARIPVIQADTNQVVTTNMEYEYIFKRPKK